jgi:signal peptidase I
MQNNDYFRKVLKNWVFPVFVALFFASVIQLFILKSVKYTGGSMEATLFTGDYIFVQKAGSIRIDDIALVKNPLYIDSKDYFFKRCVAVSGDTLEIKNSVLVVNNKEFVSIGNIKNSFRILAFDTIGEYAVTNGYYSENEYSVTGMYNINFDESQIAEIVNDSILKNIERTYVQKGYNNSLTFPYSYQYRWNKDNFGPLIIPVKGQTVLLNSESLPLYKQIITIYENNILEEKEGKYFINGIENQYYTFQKNYIFVLNDNRLDQNDSRCWGLIPEDKIYGKAIFIWFSKKREKIFSKI